MLATAEAIFTLKYILKKNYNKGSFTRFEGFAEAEITQRRIGSIRMMYSENFRSIILFNRGNGWVMYCERRQAVSKKCT